jgi:hypothetical protein
MRLTAATPNRGPDLVARAAWAGTTPGTDPPPDPEPLTPVARAGRLTDRGDTPGPQDPGPA